MRPVLVPLAGSHRHWGQLEWRNCGTCQWVNSLAHRIGAPVARYCGYPQVSTRGCCIRTGHANCSLHRQNPYGTNPQSAGNREHSVSVGCPPWQIRSGPITRTRIPDTQQTGRHCIPQQPGHPRATVGPQTKPIPNRFIVGGLSSQIPKRGVQATCPHTIIRGHIRSLSGAKQRHFGERTRVVKPGGGKQMGLNRIDHLVDATPLFLANSEPAH